MPAWVCAVTEKLSHSTVPWAGKGERRTAFYKFVPYVRRPYLPALCRLSTSNHLALFYNLVPSVPSPTVLCR